MCFQLSSIFGGGGSSSRRSKHRSGSTNRSNPIDRFLDGDYDENGNDIDDDDTLDLSFRDSRNTNNKNKHRKNHGHSRKSKSKRDRTLDGDEESIYSRCSDDDEFDDYDDGDTYTGDTYTSDTRNSTTFDDDDEDLVDDASYSSGTGTLDSSYDNGRKIIKKNKKGRSRRSSNVSHSSSSSDDASASSGSIVETISAPFRGNISEIEDANSEDEVDHRGRRRKQKKKQARKKASSRDKRPTKESTKKVAPPPAKAELLTFNIDTFPFPLAKEMLNSNKTTLRRLELIRSSQSSLIQLDNPQPPVGGIVSCSKINDDDDGNSSAGTFGCIDDSSFDAGSFRDMTVQKLVQPRTIDDIQSLFRIIEGIENLRDLELINFAARPPMSSADKDGAGDIDDKGNDEQVHGKEEDGAHEDSSVEVQEEGQELSSLKKPNFKDMLLRSIKRSEKLKEEAEKEKAAEKAKENSKADDKDDLKNLASEQELLLICNLIRKLPKLQRLSFSAGDGVTAIPEPIVHAVTTHPSLLVLQLGFHESESLSTYFSGCKNLQELRIVRADIGCTSSSKKLATDKNDEKKEATQDDDGVGGAGDDKKDANHKETDTILFKYSTVHAMSTIRFLPMAKNLRVLDLGKGVGLSGFCLRLLTTGLCDKKIYAELKLEELYFTYDPSKEIVEVGKEELADDDQADDAAVTTKDIAYQQVVVLELNNKLVHDFCTVLEKNPTLRVIRNYAFEKVLLVSQFVQDEMEEQLSKIIMERKEQALKKIHQPLEATGEADNAVNDDDDGVVLKSSHQIELKAILPQVFNIFPGSQTSLTDILANPNNVAARSGIASAFMCGITNCLMD